MKTVYKNASIVTGLSIAERGLGFLYRIVLSRYIGAEGLGIYQVSLSLFTLLSTFAAGGIPVTLSRVIAKSNAEKNPAQGRETLSAGVALSLLISLPLSLLFWLFADEMTFLFSDIRSAKVLKILLVGLGFSGVYAVVRGYFWGNKQFLASSMIEMTEEIFMVLAGIALLKTTSSPFDGAKRAAWALAVADILSCLVALLCFFLAGGRFSAPKKELKPLFNASAPITSVRASGSLVNSAVAVLFPAMLIRSGLGEGQALGLFGVVTGMVLPVLFIPATLIGSLAMVLVPELSEDFYRKNEEGLKRNIGRGLRFAFLIACALLPFFFVLGEDACKIAFSDGTAGEIVKKSCVILLPMSLTMISTSILNSIGFEKQTFLYFFLGAAALLSSILLLPSIFGVYAYVIGLGGSYTVTALCNLLFLRKKCPFLFKRVGQVCVQLVFPALIAVLPLSLFGGLFRAFFLRFTGEVLSMLLTALALAIFTFLAYRVLRFLPSPKVFLRKSQKKKRIYRKV